MDPHAKLSNALLRLLDFLRRRFIIAKEVAFKQANALATRKRKRAKFHAVCKGSGGYGKRTDTVFRPTPGPSTAILFLSIDDASADYIRSKRGHFPYKVGHVKLLRVGPDDGPFTGVVQLEDVMSIEISNTSFFGPSGSQPSSHPAPTKPISAGKSRKKVKDQPMIKESFRRSERRIS